MKWFVFAALLGVLGTQEPPTSWGTSSPFDPNAPEHLLAKPKVLETGKILIYSSSPEILLVFNRLENLGYSINVTNDVSMLLTDTLCSYDFLFVDVPYDSTLNEFAAIIEDYISRGGGLLLCQVNIPGPVTILPAGFEIDIEDTLWPEYPEKPGPATILKDHPITEGLTGDDLSGNFETVPLSNIGEGWDVLAIDEDHPDLVSLLAGRYGNGKIVYFTGNVALNSIQKGSDRFLVNLVEWVSGSGCEPTATEENNGFVLTSPVISPNPVRNKLRVSFSTCGDNPVRLSIYDPLGRKLLGMTKFLPPGFHEIEIDLNQGGLAPQEGILFLVVKEGENRWHLPFLYLR